MDLYVDEERTETSIEELVCGTHVHSDEDAPTMAATIQQICVLILYI